MLCKSEHVIIMFPGPLASRPPFHCPPDSPSPPHHALAKSMHCRSTCSLAGYRVVAMTTHPNSRPLTRAFPYTSGQEGVRRPWDPQQGRKWGDPIHSCWHLPWPETTQMLSESGDSVTGVSAFSSQQHEGKVVWEASVVTSPNSFY